MVSSSPWFLRFLLNARVAPVRFGHGWEWNGLSGSGFRFRRFLWGGGFFRVSARINREGRLRFRFRFLKNGSGGSGSAFGSWENPKNLLRLFFTYEVIFNFVGNCYFLR